MLTWGVSCGGGNLGFCFSNAGAGFGYYPLGIFWLYGATVTLEDNSAPTAALGGDLLSPGWRKPTDSLTWAASDNAGIRRRALLVDGAEVAASATDCDATRPVPCANFPASPVALGPVTDGRHEVKLVATDSAGNPTTVTQTVDCRRQRPGRDGHPSERQDDHGRGLRRRVGRGGRDDLGAQLAERTVPARCRRRSPTAR